MDGSSNCYNFNESPKRKSRGSFSLDCFFKKFSLLYKLLFRFKSAEIKGGFSSCWLFPQIAQQLAKNFSALRMSLPPSPWGASCKIFPFLPDAFPFSAFVLTPFSPIITTSANSGSVGVEKCLTKRFLWKFKLLKIFFLTRNILSLFAYQMLVQLLFQFSPFFLLFVLLPQFYSLTSRHGMKRLFASEQLSKSEAMIRRKVNHLASKKSERS